jgi:hypothetical protein
LPPFFTTSKHVRSFETLVRSPNVDIIAKAPLSGEVSKIMENYQQWKPFYMGITLNTLSQKG